MPNFSWWMWMLLYLFGRLVFSWLMLPATWRTHRRNLPMKRNPEWETWLTEKPNYSQGYRSYREPPVQEVVDVSLLKSRVFWSSVFHVWAWLPIIVIWGIWIALSLVMKSRDPDRQKEKLERSRATIAKLEKDLGYEPLDPPE